jgi:hypothetical protein
MRMLPLLLGLVAAPLLAQAPADFARQWPILDEPAEGLVRVELPAEVYLELRHPRGLDLIGFDSAGRALPLEFLPPSAAQRRDAPTARLELPLFRLPRAAEGEAPERLDLLIERDAEGRLRRLQTGIGPEAAGGRGEIWLLDASAARDRLQALVVSFEPGTTTLDARVALQASHDLANWEPLGAPQALVQISQGELRLERHRLALGGTRARYLRLLRHDAEAPLPIAGITVELRPEAEAVEPAPRWLPLIGAAEPGVPGRFSYPMQGWLPFDQLEILPPPGGSPFRARISSRASADGPLTPLGEQVVFRLGQGDDAVRPDPLRSGLLRAREWVVDTDPPQREAPRLRVGFVPEQVLVLAQGEPPYRLAAGSARAVRSAVPLQPVLAQLRARHGANWQPPLLALGESSELAGEAAFAPAPEPIAWRQLTLWAVLVLGGLLVVGLVLSLLRAPPGAGQDGGE